MLYKEMLIISSQLLIPTLEQIINYKSIFWPTKKIKKKQGDLRNSLVLQGITAVLHMAQWVSRAPPHNTLPAFLNRNGS